MTYEYKGAEGLLLKYKGSKSFLTPSQRNEVIIYLKKLTHFSVEELRDYVESTHGVVYKSKQSYYDLFDEAGISWHKSQKINPKSNYSGIVYNYVELLGIKGVPVKAFWIALMTLKPFFRTVEIYPRIRQKMSAP